MNHFLETVGWLEPVSPHQVIFEIQLQSLEPLCSKTAKMARLTNSTNTVHNSSYTRLSRVRPRGQHLATSYTRKKTDFKMTTYIAPLTNVLRDSITEQELASILSAKTFKLMGIQQSGTFPSASIHGQIMPFTVSVTRVKPSFRKSGIRHV